LSQYGPTTLPELVRVDVRRSNGSLAAFELEEIYGGIQTAVVRGLFRCTSLRFDLNRTNGVSRALGAVHTLLEPDGAA
jgi:hypothetical protein